MKDADASTLAGFKRDGAFSENYRQEFTKL
jgi:hypothetical protein